MGEGGGIAPHQKINAIQIATNLLKEANELLRKVIFDDNTLLESTANPPKRIRRLPARYKEYDNLFDTNYSASSLNAPAPQRLFKFYID